MVTFEISGVTTFWWLPFLVAASISSFTSIGGISGAFLLLPFQMSVLGYTDPSVTATNLLFNIVAIPFGVIRYIQERRMVWPLTIPILAGTIPGVVLGGISRIYLLPDPKHFKLFVAFVLLSLSLKIIHDILKNGNDNKRRKPDKFEVTGIISSTRIISYTFNDTSYTIPTIPLFFLSLIIGLVGGIYGIGGGALLVPVLVAFYRLPVHTLSGTILLVTLATSVTGVLFFSTIGFMVTNLSQPVMPDWWLGLSFGAGELLEYIPAPPFRNT